MTPKEARRLELACSLLKAAVFMSCAAGFTYQVVEFALHFWTYPTNINLEVTHPGKFMVPAFTYCNLNLVQRTQYCAKYPGRCVPPENLKSFCEQRPHYCTGNTSNLVIPLPKYYIRYTYLPENHLTYSDMIELKQNFSAFRERRYGEYAENRHDFTTKKHKRKRPVFFHGFNGFTIYESCFTENTRFDHKAEPIIKKFDEHDKGDISTVISYLTLNVEPEETFHPWAEPGAIFTIHSPFAAVNPFIKGIVLRPGNSYHIHVRLIIIRNSIPGRGTPASPSVQNKLHRLRVGLTMPCAENNIVLKEDTSFLHHKDSRSASVDSNSDINGNFSQKIRAAHIPAWKYGTVIRILTYKDRDYK
ncbi:uncharacterized protein CDAR_50321 [Caerostris darwini]|uniref:Uncharacterized protein n=1 Tax=Caerostris darwini TaxID=1538125 RepID=A0AAV4UXC5_9ARAC|nr:uncharacterized protein CDAR_50321 [Caerostris darwini]